MLQVKGEGTIAKEVEMKSVGTGLAQFSIKSTETFSSGKTFSSYFNCKAWGEIAQQVKNFPVGTRVEVHGKLKQESWKDKTTQKTRYADIIEVTAINALGDLPTQEEAPQTQPGEKPAPGEDLPF